MTIKQKKVEHYIMIPLGFRLYANKPRNPSGGWVRSIIESAKNKKPGCIYSIETIYKKEIDKKKLKINFPDTKFDDLKESLRPEYMSLDIVPSDKPLITTFDKSFKEYIMGLEKRKIKRRKHNITVGWIFQAYLVNN